MVNPDADKELRKRIAQARKKKDGSVLFVLGSGVAKGASGGAGAADWSSLLELGLSECDALNAKGLLKASATWDSDVLRQRLGSKGTDELIAVASAVEKALRTSGVYKRWLKDTVGALPLKSREVFDALAELALPVATCNYDGLSETALLRPAITWRDHGMVQRFLKGTQPGILHLHGHYNEPDSVVLGVDSYNKIVGNQHAQAVQRTLFLDRTLVFIGFGAGLEDPNLGALIDWAAQVVPGADCFHVRLCRDSERGALMGKHPLTQRIYVIGYGQEHSNLSEYLTGLTQKRAAKTTPVAQSATMVPADTHYSELELTDSMPAVRQQLDRQLRDIGEFNAFCLDYHKEVYDRFSDGMDRLARTNLLLSIANRTEIRASLLEDSRSKAAPRNPQVRAENKPEPVVQAEPRPQVNALLFLDRTAQYGRLLVGSPQSRKQNRILLLHGGPEQNLEWFVKRVEEFFQDDVADGCRVVNVPLRLNNVYAGTAEDWGLHLKHALEVHLGESSLSLADLISHTTERTRLLLSLVAEDNPLSVLGTLSARQRAGLKDFVTTLLPKHLTASRRLGITVLLPLEVHKSDGPTDLLTEVQGWLVQAWHTAERTHDILPEVRFPSWEDVASYLRSHHPPLNNLSDVIKEAAKEYEKFGRESTFEQLAKALNNIVARHS